MIKSVLWVGVAAALAASGAAPLSGCQANPPATSPATPPHKGDRNLPPESGYPATPAPDNRSLGRWMVYAYGTDEHGNPIVSCWINSDPATLRDVRITAAQYEQYRNNPDTGSIRCPA